MNCKKQSSATKNVRVGGIETSCGYRKRNYAVAILDDAVVSGGLAKPCLTWVGMQKADMVMHRKSLDGCVFTF